MINPGSKKTIHDAIADIILYSASKIQEACQVNPLDGSARPMPDIDKEPPIYGESMLHGACQAWYTKQTMERQ